MGIKYPPEVRAAFKLRDEEVDEQRQTVSKHRRRAAQAAQTAGEIKHLGIHV